MHYLISVKLDIPSNDKECFKVLWGAITNYLESHLYYVHWPTIQNSRSA